MSIVGIFAAVVCFLFGLRLLITAIQAVFTQKILVRQGIRTRWLQPTDQNDVWKVAFRDALMGVLLIVLGVMLIT